MFNKRRSFSSPPPQPNLRRWPLQQPQSEVLQTLRHSPLTDEAALANVDAPMLCSTAAAIGRRLCSTAAAPPCKSTTMPLLNIVLHEPQIPPNTGTAARSKLAHSSPCGHPLA